MTMDTAKVMAKVKTISKAVHGLAKMRFLPSYGRRSLRELMTTKIVRKNSSKWCRS